VIFKDTDATFATIRQDLKTMPVISILTAVDPARGRLFLTAYESVSIQDLPVGWSFQLLIQEDSAEPSLQKLLPNDPRISYSWNGQRGGIATTRNLGLVRAEGRYLRVLDDDDELIQGALFRDISILESKPDIAWTTSRAVDRNPDGSEYEPPSSIEFGMIEVGGLYQSWIEKSGIPPVHPATLCARTSVLRAFGGWMALPISDDVGLLMAMSNIFRGYFADHVSLRYFKSDFQVTASEYSNSPSSKQARILAISQRVQSMNGLGLNSKISKFQEE
jgi:glycosyltransferase involved in cell wall biosynthesis